MESINDKNVSDRIITCDMKQVPHWRPTNIRRHDKKNLSHLGDLVPGISAPLPWRDFKNLDLELWVVNNLMYETVLEFQHRVVHNFPCIEEFHHSQLEKCNNDVIINVSFSTHHHPVV